LKLELDNRVENVAIEMGLVCQNRRGMAVWKIAMSASPGFAGKRIF
jgi:hypothetical protein